MASPVPPVTSSTTIFCTRGVSPATPVPKRPAPKAIPTFNLWGASQLSSRRTHWTRSSSASTGAKVRQDASQGEGVGAGQRRALEIVPSSSSTVMSQVLVAVVHTKL